jgi:hypothetical protein
LGEGYKREWEVVGAPYYWKRRGCAHYFTLECTEANIWREDLLAKKQLIENEKLAYKRI